MNDKLFFIYYRRLSRRGGLSATEKLLFLVAAFGFFLCVTLLVGLGVMVGHHISCTNSTTGNHNNI